MKLIKNKSDIINGFFWVFVVVQLVGLLTDIIHGYPKDSWGVTEFLINYEGGFVRRGLLGQLLLNVYWITGLSPYYFILLIALGAYITLCLFFVKGFLKNKYPVFILPFVVLLGNPILNGFWLRKDSLILCLYILSAYLLRKKTIPSLVFMNIVLSLGILIHESIAFIAFPVFLLLLYSFEEKEAASVKSFPIKLSTAFLKLVPAVTIFILVSFHKGDKQVAQSVWSSWDNVSFPIESTKVTPQASIQGLSLSLKHGYDITYGTLVNFQDNIYAPVFWIIILLTIYYLLTHTEMFMFRIGNYIPLNAFNKIELGNILVLQLFAVAPLFILGLDYGRWVYLWTISSFSIALLFKEPYCKIVFPEIITRIRKRMEKFLNIFFTPPSVRVLIFFVFFPACSWKLLDAIQSGAIYYVLGFFSTTIRDALMYIKYGCVLVG